MKIIFATFLAFSLFTLPAMAAEQVDLTAPDQVQAGTSVYIIKELNFDWGNKTIVIVLRGSGGEHKEVVYREEDGSVTLMRSLNKADLSTKSLHRRVMEKLIADGRLAGSISGTPD